MKKLVVALHDVAPPFELEIRAQLTALAQVGVRRVALKVVPDWHGACPLDKSPSLVALLCEMENQGCEIVLHGYRHLCGGRLGGEPLQRLRGSLFAAQAAEFLSLTEEQADVAIMAGLEMLERCGLSRPRTFCPPAWLMAKSLESVVRHHEFDRLVRMMSVNDLRDERVILLPAFGYMGAGSLHEAGVELLNEVLRPWVSRASRAKVFLHPDPSGRQSWRRVVEEIGQHLAGGGWRPSLFAEL
ncbi:MAG TPA: DUF2334 domain-containing protein [Chloroflexota bacterium]|nr:DUF2334 domain-containing protein [Chloroflexota bacterium]